MELVVHNDQCVVLRGPLTGPSRVRLGPALDLKGLVEYITGPECKFEPSKVTRKSQWGSDQVCDPTVRMSETTRPFTLQVGLDLTPDQEDAIWNLLPPLYRSGKLSEVMWDSASDGSVLKYLPGCFFSKHTDAVDSVRHMLTVLYYPPLLDYTGGELVLYTGADEVVIDRSMHKDSWLVVMFQMGVPHEVKPVTSGVRYTIKTKFQLPDCDVIMSSIKQSKSFSSALVKHEVANTIAYITEDGDSDSDPDEHDSNEDFDAEDEEVAEASAALRKAKNDLRKAKISALQKRMLASLQRSLDAEITNNVNVSNDCSRGLVILNRLYLNTDLTGSHQQLFESLRERYRMVDVVTMQFKNSFMVTRPGRLFSINARMGGCDNDTTVLNFLASDYSDDSDDIFVDGFKVYQETAELVDVFKNPHLITFEYNDEGYDTNHFVYKTAIIFAGRK